MVAFRSTKAQAFRQKDILKHCNKWLQVNQKDRGQQSNPIDPTDLKHHLLLHLLCLLVQTMIMHQWKIWMLKHFQQLKFNPHLHKTKENPLKPLYLIERILKKQFPKWKMMNLQTFSCRQFKVSSYSQLQGTARLRVNANK